MSDDPHPPTAAERAEWRKDATSLRGQWNQGNLLSGRILRLLDALEACERERDYAEAAVREREAWLDAARAFVRTMAADPFAVAFVRAGFGMCRADGGWPEWRDLRDADATMP